MREQCEDWAEPCGNELTRCGCGTRVERVARAWRDSGEEAPKAE